MSRMPAPHPDKKLLCGQCRWYFVGHEGQTCIKLRGVQQMTPACIEWEPFKPSPFHKIVTDKYLVGLQNTVQILPPEDVARIEAELKGYKISAGPKISMNDFGNEADLLAIVNKFERNQAYTERLVEMKEDLMDRLNKLNRLMKDAQAYILSNYREQVQSFKNEGERGAFYLAALPHLFKAIDTVDDLVKKIDRLLQNHKDTHFSLCQIQDGVKRIWDFRIQAMATGQRVKG